MPSANGVYSLPSGYLAVTGATIQASQHNPPLEDIAAALTGRLSRDGTAPMTGALQLASGTVSLPGQVFAVDPSSGWYKTTNGIGVAIGGVKVAEFLAGGIIGARLIGELVPYTGTSAPSSLFVLPYGQTLSRTTYAALWAFAQIEIAAGNTFYNNGDGSTTFGIGDMRGRIPVAWDKMGGTASGRLTSAGGGVDGTTIGAVGGGQNVTLARANLPNTSVSVTITDPGHTHGFSVGGATASVFYAGGTAYGYGAGSYTGVAPPQIASATTGISAAFNLNGNVTQTAVQNLPPSLVCNYILFAGGSTS